MLGTLVFGSFIALGRNIRVTFDVMSAGVVEGILFGNSAPGNEKNRLRRILQQDSLEPSYSFIYFDEESLSKERSLFRSGDIEIVDSIGDLITRADLVLESVSTMTLPPLNPNLNIRTSPALYQVEEAQKNTTLLGLAYFLTGREEFAEQGCNLVQRWFVNPQTQMTPMDLYQSTNRQNIYQLLDAIQMMQGHLEDHEFPLVQDWFRNYLVFFEKAGTERDQTTSYDGLYYDIEDMAVSHFVRDEARIALIYKRAYERLAKQVSADGSMPQILQTSQCEHYQMYELQGWWTLARLFANAMGESLWTAEKDALCRASGFAIPYLRIREPCSNEHDDRRWWPIVVDTLRHCETYQAKRLRWRDWMSPESKEVPASLYSMPRHYGEETGIAPFWNLGTFVKKSPSHPESRSFTKDNKSGIHIPAKLLKAAETDPDISTRVMRIRRWHQLGQKEIAERMLKKAIKDLRGTKVVWQPKDIIPQAMIDAARNDPTLEERVTRIRRWDSLGQASIVERMVKKTMEELKMTAEDEASVEALNKQTEYSQGANKGSFLRAQKGEDQNYGEAPPQASLKSSLLKKLLKKKEAETPQAQSSSMEIPASLIQQSQSDPELAKRIYRIQRWKKLGQHEIVDKMIRKLLAATEEHFQ